jgi:hypothetical protein
VCRHARPPQHPDHPGGGGGRGHHRRCGRRPRLRRRRHPLAPSAALHFGLDTLVERARAAGRIFRHRLGPRRGHPDQYRRPGHSLLGVVVAVTAELRRRRVPASRDDAHPHSEDGLAGAAALGPWLSAIGDRPERSSGSVQVGAHPRVSRGSAETELPRPLCAVSDAAGRLSGLTPHPAIGCEPRHAVAPVASGFDYDLGFSCSSHDLGVPSVAYG